MRTIIAGSRNIKSYYTVLKAIRASKFEITEVVSGDARGVDKLGMYYAHIKDIPCKIFPADWDHLGASAGPVRNKQMAENADALIAVWDGESRGTKNMIEIATKKKLKVFVYTVE